MEAQKTDSFYGPIYQYLDTQKLPENDEKARYIIIESEFYDIHEGLLYRLSLREYSKNNSLLRYCLALPQEFEQTVIEYYHNKGHFSVWKVLHAMRDRYHCPRLKAKILYHIQRCEHCQSYTNPRRDQKAKITPKNLHSLFEAWHLDLKGPLTAENVNYRYILVAIEATSRYMELVPLLDCSTNTVMKAFYDNVILRHGPPKIIYTDRASYFRSQSMQSVAKMLNCEHRFYLSYTHYSAGTN